MAIVLVVTTPLKLRRLRMGRGVKICPAPECGEANGPRAFNCKSCNYAFEVKSKKRRQRKRWEDYNWKTLRKGDIIKVKTGSGPFWVNERDGEMQTMGVYGTFKVSGIRKDGIVAYPHENKSHSGCCFVYMGEYKYCEATGVEQRPHKILRFIPKEVKNEV